MAQTIQTVTSTGIPSAAGRTAIDSIKATVDDNVSSTTQDFSFVNSLSETFPDILFGSPQNTLYNLVNGDVTQEGSPLHQLSLRVLQTSRADRFEEGGKYFGEDGRDNLLLDMRKVADSIKSQALQQSYTGKDFNESALERRRELILGDSYTPRVTRDSETVSNPAIQQQGVRVHRNVQFDANQLGFLTSIYESNNDSTTISTGQYDTAGGKSYGKFQLSSRTGTLNTFLNSEEGRQFASYFQGLQPGTDRFDRAWKRAYRENPEIFEKAQSDFITRTHYEPVLSVYEGLNKDQRGIQEFIFSAATQHSHQGNRAIFESFKRDNPDWESMSYADQLRGLYRARWNYASAHIDEGARAGVLRRYNEELDTTLSLLGNEGRLTAQQREGSAERQISERPEYPVASFVGLINRYPERFPEFVNNQGKFKFTEDERGILAFKNELDNNQEFVDRLLTAEYSDFKNELGKLHNNVFESNDHKMRAYAIFSHFGAEGLTQYSNYFEAYDPNRETQNQKFLEAERYLGNTTVDGYTPIQYMQKFAEGFRMQRVVPNIETQIEFPKDLSKLTTGSYFFDEQSNTFVRKENSLITRHLTQKFLSHTDYTAEDVSEYGSDAYMEMVFRVADEIPPMELLRTLKGISTYEAFGGSSLAGREGQFHTYRIQNWRDLDIDHQLALDALKFNPDTRHMIRNDLETRGRDIIIEPDRAERLQRLGGSLGVLGMDDKFIDYEHIFLLTEEDPEGNRVLRKGIVPTAWNSIGTWLLGKADFAALEIPSWFANAGVTAAGFFSDDAADFAQALYDNSFGERRAYNLFDQQGFTDNPIESTVGIVREFKNWISLLRGVGRGGFSALYKANEVARRHRQAAQLGAAAGVLKTGKDHGKYELLLRNLSRDANNSRLLGGQFILGDAIVSAGLPQDLSFYGSGIIDMVAGTDTREWYTKSNLMTQVGADVLTNVGLGVLFDGVIASARAVRPSARADNGFFRTAWQKSDTGDFFRHLSEQVNTLPLQAARENVQTVIRAANVDGTNINNLNDLAQYFRANTGEVFGTLRADIEQTLRHYDLKFTRGVRENLSESADTIYRETIDNFARKIHAFANEGAKLAPGPTFSERFARALAETSPVIRTVTSNKGSNPLTMAEANFLYSQGPYRKIVKVDGGYQVEELVPDTWTAELIDSIRRTDTFSSPSSYEGQLRVATEERLGRSLTAEEETAMTESITHFGGAPVRVAVQDGFVIGSLGDAWAVRTLDGEILHTSIPDEALAGHLARRVNDGKLTPQEFDDILRDFGITGVTLDGVVIPDRTPQRLLAESEEVLRRKNQKLLTDGKSKQSAAEAEHQNSSVRKNSISDEEASSNNKKVKRSIEKKKKGESTDSPTVDNLVDEKGNWGFATRILKKYGLSAKGKSPKTVAYLIASKLGVDDLWALYSKGSSKKGHLVGNNNAIPTEYKVQKGKQIPKNTVVKVTNEDGTVNHFMSTRKLSATEENRPSRFVISDEGIRHNPFWNQVDVNVTMENGMPRGFVRDEDGLYRPAEQGEAETFINVQNPYRIEDDPSILTDPMFERTLAREGYDAAEVMLDGQLHYYLVDEVFQPIRPSQLLEDLTYTGRKQDIVFDRLSMGGGAMVGAALAGAATAPFMEFEEDEFGMAGVSSAAGIGAALGTLLGMRRRTRPPRIKAATKTRSNPKYPTEEQAAQGALRDNADLKQEFKHFDMKVNTNDPLETKQATRFLDSFKHAVSNMSVKNFQEWWATNRYAQAGIQLFIKYGGPLGKKLGNFLYDIDTEKARMLQAVNKGIDDKLGAGAHNWLRGSSSENPITTKVRDYLVRKGIEVDDARAYEAWNTALDRIIRGEIVATADGVRFNVNKQSIRQAYEQNPLKRELDNFLVQQPEIQAIRESIIVNLVRPTRKLHFELLAKDIDTQLGNIRNIAAEMDEPKLITLTEQWTKTRQSYSEFIRDLSPDERGYFKSYYSKKGIGKYLKRIGDRQNERARFINQGDGYLPMVRDSRKIKNIYDQYRQGFMRENPDATIQQAENFANQRMFNDLADVNRGQIDGSKLQQYDPEAQRFTDLVYADRKSAVQELTNITYGSNFTPELQRAVTSNIGRYIKQLPDKVTNGGKTIPQYALRLPDNLDPQLRQAFESYQGEQFAGFFSNLYAGNIVRNSNHLTQPVRYELPEAWRQTNIDELITRYVNDSTPMLHMRGKGIFEEADIEKLFFSPHNGIRANLKKQGFDDDKVNEVLSRMEDIYRMQNGIYNRASNASSPAQRARELQAYLRAQKISGTLRNLMQGAHGYFIAMLDTAQSLIYGPALSSGRSVKETYKMFLRDRQKLQRAENFASMLGLSMKKMEVYKPQLRMDGAEELTGLRWHDQALDWGYLQSAKLADFSSSMSFTKYALRGINKVTGGVIRTDIGDLGLMRLAFDDFYGVNSVSTTVNMTAGFVEADHLARIWRQFQMPENAGVTSIEGMSRQDVIDKFARLGIHDVDNPAARLDRFVKNSEDINRFVNSEDAFNADILSHNREAWEDMTTIAQYITDAYHGKNRMNRPETWSSPWGKLISQYSVYPFNLAMQVFNRRLADPIRAFNARVDAGEFGNISRADIDGNWYSIIHHARNNNTAKLKQMGLTDEMIQAIPAEQFDHMYRALWLAVGTNAMLFSRDALRDVVESEVLGGEEWRRSKRRLTLNPFDPESERKTLGQIADGTGLDIDDFYHIIRYSVARFNDSSLFGRYDTFLDFEGWERQGIMNILGPGVSTLSDITQTAGRVLATPPSEIPSTVPRDVSQQILNFTPVSTYTGQFRRRLDEIPNNETGQIPLWGIER